MQNHPELCRVLEVWPDLPAETREQILKVFKV
jgi:hypothetical protein